MGRVVSCSKVKAWVNFYINSLQHSDPQHYVKTKRQLQTNSTIHKLPLHYIKSEKFLKMSTTP